MTLVSSLVFKMLYLKNFNYNNKWLNVENSIHTGDNGYIFLNYSKKDIYFICSNYILTFKTFNKNCLVYLKRI